MFIPPPPPIGKKAVFAEAPFVDAKPVITTRPPMDAAPPPIVPNLVPKVTLEEKRQQLAQRANFLEETRPKRQADVEPLGVNNSVRIVSDPPPLYDAQAFTFGFMSKQTTKDDTFGMIVPDRPSAPSPDTAISGKARDIIQKAEEFLETFAVAETEAASEKTVVPVAKEPSKCKNLLGAAEKAAFIESLPLFRVEGDSLSFLPAGHNLKSNIIRAWQDAFDTDTLDQFSSAPFVPLEQVERIPICSCKDCGFVIDVVHTLSANKNEGYEGSSLEQLQKKMKMTRIACPKCAQVDNGFSDPMYGINHVTVTVGGSLMGATAEDGNTVLDPSLYKIVPSTVMQRQNHLMDDTFTNTSAVAKPKVQVIEEAKIVAEPTPSAYLKTSLSGANETGFQIETVFYPCIGRVPSKAVDAKKSALDLLADPTVATLLCISIPTGGHETVASERKISFLSKEDQYLKRKPASLYLAQAKVPQEVAHLIEKAHFLLDTLVHPCGTDARPFVRELLPSELVGKLPTSGYSIQLADVSLFSILVWPSTKNQARVTCECAVETLLRHTLLSAARLDETRPYAWLYLPLDVTPFDVAFISDSPKNTQAFRKALVGLKCTGLIDWEQADRLGIPFTVSILSAPPVLDGDQESVFNVKAIVRSRDSTLLQDGVSVLNVRDAVQ